MARPREFDREEALDRATRVFRAEVDRSLDCATAASFIQMTMQGLQLAARGGANAATLRARKHDSLSNA